MKKKSSHLCPTRQTSYFETVTPGCSSPPGDTSTTHLPREASKNFELWYWYTIVTYTERYIALYAMQANWEHILSLGEVRSII